MSEVKISIDKKTGKMEIEAHGFKGSGCSSEINAILRQIGGKTLKTTRKKEYGKVRNSVRVK